MPVMSKCGLRFIHGPGHTSRGLNRVESPGPVLKQYLFAAAIAKSGANVQSVPGSCDSALAWLFRTCSFLSRLAIFRNVSSISASGALPKGPFFLAVLFRCSPRRNPSRYTLDQLAAIWAQRSTFLPAIEKLDLAVQINRRLANDVDGDCAGLAQLGKCHLFLSPTVLGHVANRGQVYVEAGRNVSVGFPSVLSSI